MPQANAEEGTLHPHNELPDRRFLFNQPRVLGFLPDILRPTHDEHQVIGGEIRNRVATIEFDHIPDVTVLAKEVPKHPRMFYLGMLEDDDSHGLVGIRGCRSLP